MVTYWSPYSGCLCWIDLVRWAIYSWVIYSRVAERFGELLWITFQYTYSMNNRFVVAISRLLNRQLNEDLIHLQPNRNRDPSMLMILICHFVKFILDPYCL